MKGKWPCRSPLVELQTQEALSGAAEMNSAACGGSRAAPATESQPASAPSGRMPRDLIPQRREHADPED